MSPSEMQKEIFRLEKMLDEHQRYAVTKVMKELCHKYPEAEITVKTVFNGRMHVVVIGIPYEDRFSIQKKAWDVIRDCPDIVLELCSCGVYTHKYEKENQ